MAFPGFSKQGLRWLSELKDNNNREWFQASKQTYEQELKLPLLALVDSLNNQIAAKLPEYFLDEPAKATFRIYRDTRFSKNKTPYKTHVSAAFPRRGLLEKAAGLYFQISGEAIGIAGGSYNPLPDSLLAIRTRIAEEHVAFEKLTHNKKLVKMMGELQGEQLRRIPKGFPPDHPMESALRRKQFYFWAELDGALAGSPRLEKELITRFEAL
ncbi:MAG: DUF2461 domain-containing protein, partial [Bryobacterales bacterium]|nr:DUF2461 domain-containing protein [Bryobacterales bacterium]